MEKLLKEMEPRTMALLMVSTALLVAAALASYVIVPEIKDYRKSLNALTVLEKVTASGDSLEQEMTALRSDVERLTRELHGDMVNLPENQLESFVIGRLQGISWRNNIELLGVTPGKGGMVQIFEETLFDVEVAGDYFDLYAWLQELGNELGFVVVKKFNIRPLDAGKTPPRLNARLTIVSYREVSDA